MYRIIASVDDGYGIFSNWYLDEKFVDEESAKKYVGTLEKKNIQYYVVKDIID